MAELFFILTVIFVSYVVFVVIGDKKGGIAVNKTAAAKPAAEPTVSVVSAETEKPALKPVISKPVSSKNPAAKTATVAGDSLKNPQTGEITKIPTNYAFAKRWIKDALVTEGLLEKVYKNNELDEAAKLKIQEALQKLQAIDKYQ